MPPNASKSISWFSRWTLTPTLMSENPIAVRHSLIRLLAMADRNSLDARRAIELFSQEHWGIHRVRLRQLLGAMNEKTKILEALEKHPRLLGDQAMLAVRLGRSTETLPAVWQELAQWTRPIHTDTTHVWRNSKTYWIAVALAMTIVSLFIALRVAPTLKMMMNEFGFENIGDLVIASHMDRFIFRCLLGAVALTLAWIAWLFLTWHPKSWLRRVTARWSVARGSLETDVWQLIAMNLASGVQAKTTIEHLARLHEDNRMKRKLHRANDAMATGVEVWQSMVNVKLLHSTERQAIIASDLPDVQAWTIRHLALKRRESLHFHSLRRKMWSQPIITLVFGSFVLMIAYAMFTVLSQMVLVMAERHG